MLDKRKGGLVEGGTAENKPGSRSRSWPQSWSRFPVQVPGPSPVENNRVPESYSLLWRGGKKVI